jgi:uncharacterized protein (TIGR02452 family)
MSDSYKRLLQAVSEETLKILSQGYYFHYSGVRIELNPILTEQSRKSLHYPPDHVVMATAPLKGSGSVHVVADSSIDAITNTKNTTDNPCCLVFASARRPGGGHLNGADAQEESIVRASTLLPSLVQHAGFYKKNESNDTLYYSDSIIYTPHAAVIRDSRHCLLTNPFDCSFINAAAPNAGAIAKSQVEDLDRIPEIVARRAGRVLDIAVYHGHRHLILGAWGCGVFGIDPRLMASTFSLALKERPWFDSITFAVPKDRSENYQVFLDQFKNWKWVD